MLWELAFKLLIIKSIAILLFGLFWGVLSQRARRFIAQHWPKITPVMWAIIFIITFPVGGFLTALVVPTTTCFIIGLWLRFKRWTYAKQDRKPEKKQKTTFRSVESFLEGK